MLTVSEQGPGTLELKMGKMQNFRIPKALHANHSNCFYHPDGQRHGTKTTAMCGAVRLDCPKVFGDVRFLFSHRNVRDQKVGNGEVTSEESMRKVHVIAIKMLT